MKKTIFLLLLLSSPLTAKSLCHDCALWLSEHNVGRVHTVIIKIRCSLKRFITRRYCCSSLCYKNNPNYRAKVVSFIKDKKASGLVRCNRCGKHHICHVCGRRLCTPSCNDHDLVEKEDNVVEDAVLIK